MNSLTIKSFFYPLAKPGYYAKALEEMKEIAHTLRIISVYRKHSLSEKQFNFYDVAINAFDSLYEELVKHKNKATYKEAIFQTSKNINVISLALKETPGMPVEKGFEVFLATRSHMDMIYDKIIPVIDAEIKSKKKNEIDKFEYAINLLGKSN